jgi:hypothetical protein
MPTLVNITLTDLHCIAEHDASGGSEPYVWVCFFGLDGCNIAQPEPMTVFSPAFDGFRTAMPNGHAAREGHEGSVPDLELQSGDGPGPRAVHARWMCRRRLRGGRDRASLAGARGLAPTALQRYLGQP